MYLKIHGKKINIKKLTKFGERFKGLKMVLEPIDYGVCFPKKRFISTYFLCQRVDVVITDSNDIVLDIIENVKSEKILIRLKSKYTYFLPLNTAKWLDIGDKLNLREKEVND